MIFDHAVRLQHVRADLRSEFDDELRVLNFLGGRALLLHFEFIELGAQHAHGALFVFVLRALVLAIRDQAGGNVRDATAESVVFDAAPLPLER